MTDRKYELELAALKEGAKEGAKDGMETVAKMSKIID